MRVSSYEVCSDMQKHNQSGATRATGKYLIGEFDPMKGAEFFVMHRAVAVLLGFPLIEHHEFQRVERGWLTW